MAVLLGRQPESNSLGGLTGQSIRQLLCAPWFLAVGKQKSTPWCVGIDHKAEWDNISEIDANHLAESIRQKSRYNLLLINTIGTYLHIIHQRHRFMILGNEHDLPILHINPTIPIHRIDISQRCQLRPPSTQSTYDHHENSQQLS